MINTNLFARVASALVLSPLIIALIFLSPTWAVLGAVSAVSGLIALEVFSLFFSKTYPWQRALCALLAAASCAAVSLFNTNPLYLLLAFAALPLVSFPLFMFHPSDITTSSRGPFVTMASAFYAGGLFGFSGLLFSSSDLGPHWLLTLLCATFLGDTGAYAFGMMIGGPKLAPRLSPGKTWAGAVGGAFSTTATLVACRFAFFPDIPLWPFLVFGPILSLACQLGDLAESFLKRGLGVKDSGNLIPGHGGLLDRCDALLFSSPFMYIFFLLLHSK